MASDQQSCFVMVTFDMGLVFRSISLFSSCLLEQNQCNMECEYQQGLLYLCYSRQQSIEEMPATFKQNSHSVKFCQFYMIISFVKN